MFSNVITLIACLTIAVSVKAEPYGGYPVPLIPESITTGTEVPKESIPWQVSLQYGLPDSRHFCSGAIVDMNWVVTSGYCASNIPSSTMFFVAAGLHDLSATESNAQYRTVIKTVVHEKYKGTAGPDDIALLKISPPFTPTNGVKVVTLPPNSKPTGSVSLTSWALTLRTYYPHLPNKLQKLMLTVLDLDKCRDKVASYVGRSSITDSNVCTAPLPDSFTACNTDPGSPLVAPRGPLRTLEGIVSWGIVPCGTKDIPLIYTEISSYKNWIENVINNN